MTGVLTLGVSPATKLTTTNAYPTTAPTSATYYTSPGNVGNPDTNPGAWSLDGGASAWFNNGTAWELDYSFASHPSGYSGIAKFVQGGVTSAWTNIIAF